MKKLLSVLLAMTLLAGLLCLSAAAAEETAEPVNPFTDVADDAYYKDAVLWALEQGVTTGVTETQFQPDATCTRGQVVTFLWRAKGEPEPAAAENPFTDVEETSPFYKAILWAAETGITTGRTETTFEPGGLCTNAHVVTFLWRAEGEPEAAAESDLAASYEDGAYYKDAVAWADAAGLLAGAAFVAGDNSPRANIVTYLYRNLAGQEEPAEPETEEPETTGTATLLYLGHGSLRVVSPEGKVIYIDPYAGDQYDLAADLILVTHGHPDHTQVDLITERNEGCQIITHEEANLNGDRKSFDLGYVKIQAVEAGNNPNHDINVCVGYVLTFSDGKTLYVSGDTSTTDQMAEMGSWGIDYAFFCCDGRFNMDTEEASACAVLVGAKHSIPYHMAPGSDFSQEVAEQFQAEGRIILPAGEELVLE